MTHGICSSMQLANEQGEVKHWKDVSSEREQEIIALKSFFRMNTFAIHNAL
jgi:hypothetical protein